MTTVSASIPSLRQALAESYSQFVPGNTGITTRGRAMPFPRTAGVPFSQATGATAPVSAVRVG